MILFRSHASGRSVAEVRLCSSHCTVRCHTFLFVPLLVVVTLITWWRHSSLGFAVKLLLFCVWNCKYPICHQVFSFLVYFLFYLIGSCSFNSLFWYSHSPRFGQLESIQAGLYIHFTRSHHFLSTCLYNRMSRCMLQFLSHGSGINCFFKKAFFFFFWVQVLVFWSEDVASGCAHWYWGVAFPWLCQR